MLFRGCREIKGSNDRKACRGGRGCNAYREPIGADGLGAVRAVTPVKPVGAVSDRRDDSGSTYSTNSTYS